MPSLSTIIAVVAAASLIALAGAGFLLKRSYERNGALATSLKTATTRLTEINNAMRERDKVDGANRALSNDALFDGLRQ